MPWTNITFAFGSKLTSAKMTNLMNNFKALANSNAGAPKIANQALNSYPWQNSALYSYPWGNEDIRSQSIAYGQLQTETQTQTGTVAAESSVRILMSEGALWPSITSTRVLRVHSTVGASGGGDSPEFTLYNPNPDFSADYTVVYRRIKS